jgi:hypothetical protein
VTTHPDWSQYRSVRVDEWLPGVVRSAVANQHARSLTCHLGILRLMT